MHAGIKLINVSNHPTPTPYQYIFENSNNTFTYIL